PLRLLSSRLLPLYLHRYQLRKQALGPVVRLLRKDESARRVVGDWWLVDAGRQHPSPNLRGLPPAEPPPPGTGAAPAVGLMHSWLRDYRLSPPITAALERLLRRCRASGIDVVLVGIPVLKAHRDLYPPEIDATYLGYLHALQARYGCRFADFRDRVPDHAYGDALHYTQPGAEYFSCCLAREVLIPLWRELESE